MRRIYLLISFIFIPAILYPYHLGDTKTDEIVKLLDNSGIEVRIRNLK